MRNWERIGKYSAISIGIAVIIAAFICTVFSNLNLGLFLAYGIGFAFLTLGIFWQKIHIAVKISAAFAAVFITVFVSGLFVCGTSDNITYNEDAIIVLGAGIRGETVGKGLQRRLDRAIEYHKENPDAIIVVSGGQGHQEDITEALAMERYLLEKGIPAGKIIKEENSTGTNENFRFSKEILDEHLQEDYTVAFVTTEYHIYRAENIAELEGFSEVTHCHSNSNPASVIPNGLREMCAVLKMWVFG